MDPRRLRIAPPLRILIHAFEEVEIGKRFDVQQLHRAIAAPAGNAPTQGMNIGTGSQSGNAGQGDVHVQRWLHAKHARDQASTKENARNSRYPAAGLARVG